MTQQKEHIGDTNKMVTAVEWLIKEIKNFDSGRSQYYNKVAIYDNAYRIEKEQISEAYRMGVEEDVYNNPLKTGEQYYNETFKK